MKWDEFKRRLSDGFIMKKKSIKKKNQLTMTCLLLRAIFGIMGSMEWRNSIPLAISRANLNAWFWSTTISIFIFGEIEKNRRKKKNVLNSFKHSDCSVKCIAYLLTLFWVKPTLSDGFEILRALLGFMLLLDWTEVMPG